MVLYVALFFCSLLSYTFYPSVEAKCTLEIAVCRFSELLLILGFKSRYLGCILVYKVPNKSAFTGKFIIKHTLQICDHLYVRSFQIVRFVPVISEVSDRFEKHRLVTR